MAKLICPNCGTQVTHENQFDGRAIPWRVRVRLFGPDNEDELQADSDPDVEPEALGDTIMRGLPAVCEHVAQLAAQFHQMPCLGLDMDTLRHRLKGLRPTLSRRGGEGTWRIPYETPRGKWLARVDLARENTGESNGGETRAAGP